MRMRLLIVLCFAFLFISIHGTAVAAPSMIDRGEYWVYDRTVPGTNMPFELSHGFLHTTRWELPLWGPGPTMY